MKSHDVVWLEERRVERRSCAVRENHNINKHTIVRTVRLPSPTPITLAPAVRAFG